MDKDKILVLLKEKSFWLLFSLVLIIGIFLRFLIVKLPLWYDEGCSWLIASKTFPFGINDYLFNKDFQHTPLYFYYLHFWMKCFGQSDISLRLSSLIPSISIMPLVYIVTRHIASKKTALIAMFLTSINVFQIFFASEVRMYPFVIILTLLSVDAMLRYISDFKVHRLIEMVIVNAIMSYIMVGAPIFIIAQYFCLISYLVQKQLKSEIKKVLLSSAAFLVLLIPYFFIIVHYYLVRNDFLVFHSIDFTFFNVIGILQKFLSQYVENALYWATVDPYVIGTKEFITFIIPLCLMMFALYRAIIKNDEKVRLVVFLTAITFLAFILTAQCHVIVLSPRYLIYISPLLLILSAIGISTFGKKKAAAFLLFYFIACFVYISNESGVIDYKRHSLYAPVQYIQNHNLQSSDLIIMPFGCSVIGHYLNNNSPRVLNFEAIQEFRKIENDNIYSVEQQQLLKMLNKSKIFTEIIIPDTNISSNFENLIKSNISSVPKGGTVLLIVTGTDRLSLMDNPSYYNYFNNLKNPENVLIFALMTEFFHSLNKLLSENFQVVSVENDSLQMYVTYKKIK